MTDSPAPTGCVACSRGSDEIPLLAFDYRGTSYRICPQHLPWLIHDPGRLADALPGAADLPQGRPPT